MASLLYVLTHSTEDPDRAVTGLAAAAAALRGGHDVALWLTGEGVRLGVQGVAETLHEPVPRSAASLLEALEEGAVPLYLERSSFERRQYDESALRPGAKVAAAEQLATLLAEGRSAVTL